MLEVSLSKNISHLPHHMKASAQPHAFPTISTNHAKPVQVQKSQQSACAYTFILNMHFMYIINFYNLTCFCC